jgi:hypothetical protein
MSPGPDYIESINPIFLTTLQGILAVLEDDVAPIIPENIYLTLVNELQMLYNIHNATANHNASANHNATANTSARIIYAYDSISYTYDSSANYLTGFGRMVTNSSSSTNNNNNNNYGGPVHRIVYPRS